MVHKGNTRAIVGVKIALLSVALGWLLVAPAAASPTDAWITTKVKLALLTTEGVSGTAVNVDTVKGQVTLHGKVSTAEEKQKAEAEAKKIDGVQGVRNLLQVVAAERKSVVNASDDHLKDQVSKALKGDEALKDSSISVQSVNNGVVLLAGNAKTLSDHLEAVEVAALVPGVRRVASEIKSPETFGDAEIWHGHEGTAEMAHGHRSMSTALHDAYITSATKMRLLADRNAPALDINVDTRGGVVTLFGMVPSPQAKAAAEADAKKVSGVQRVVNELQVVPETKREMVKVKDDQIERDVKKAFENHDDFKHINVDVRNCVARLSGTVPNGMQRLEAAVVARSTQGVCSVQDDLRIAN